MQTAVGSDLRADRQNLSLEAYDFTIKPAASEMRPYHSCRNSSSKSLPSGTVLAEAPFPPKTAKTPGCPILSAIAPLASYREMLLHDFVSQLRDGALGDDAAPIQDREIVGQLPAEFQILLHQKDRDGLLSQKLNDLANLVDDVGLDSLGWFVED